MARKAIFLLALLVWTLLACNAPVGPTMVKTAYVLYMSASLIWGCSI